MFSQISSSSSFPENNFSRERSLSQKHSIPLLLESFARNCLALCMYSSYPPPRYSAQQAAASGASPRRKRPSRVKLSCSVCECDPKGRSRRPDLVLKFLNWKKEKRTRCSHQIVVEKKILMLVTFYVKCEEEGLERQSWTI